MAIVANTYLTFDSKGNKEELADVIYNISPEQTPYTSNIGRGKCDSTFPEWQQDSLVAADGTNAKLEGNDHTAFAAAVPTVRIGARTQISDKDLILSDTQEVIDKAGRKSEEAYQMAKKGKELKRDVEKILLSNQGSTSGNSTTARKTPGILAYIKTNVDKEASGVNPVYTNEPTDVRTDGTPRAFTETIAKAVVALMWTEGADLKLLMVGAFNKGAFSAFAGVATKTFYQSAVKETAIIGAADIYVSNFGNFSVVANRFQRPQDGLFVDPSQCSIKWLRPFKRVKLAKTGDAEKRLIVGEYAHVVKNEKGLGLAADLTS